MTFAALRRPAGKFKPIFSNFSRNNRPPFLLLALKINVKWKPLHKFRFESPSHRFFYTNKYIPSQHTTQQRSVQTFWRRQPSLHLGYCYFVFRCAGQQTQPTRYRTEYITWRANTQIIWFLSTFHCCNRW